jgi:hypothetical protein
MTHEASFGLAEAPASAERRIIPFDYAFRFKNLAGTPGAVQSQKITISVEAPFTVVSIGYGVIPFVKPIRFGPNPIDFLKGGTFFAVALATAGEPFPQNIGEIRLKHLVAELDRRSPGERDLILKHGLRLNPEFAGLPIGGKQTKELLEQAFEAIAAPPEQIQFTYALFDDGSGREFQSEPILNTAGLGTANGERPFRYLARPITFAPLAVIRMEITELSTPPEAELHVSLQGYKMLGGSGSPTGSHLGRVRRRRRR